MTTKTFDVIPIEDYGVVVDKEATKQSGELVFNSYLFGIGNIKDCIHKATIALPSNSDTYKVVASIYRRIEGIPLIYIRDNIEKLAKSYAKTGIEDIKADWVELLIAGTKKDFIAGYKAASKERIYSEEDIQAIRNMLIEGALSDMSCSSAIVEMDRILSNKYNKLPKQAELEMEKKDRAKGLHSETNPYILKITNPETNTINPVKLIYE